MAFFFTHCWLAKLALQESKGWLADYLLKPENIDDYYFGAIAPDVRYVKSVDRALTHKVHGQESVLAQFKRENYSKAFLAGYETHLIVDSAWANDKKWLDKSVYENYMANPENPVQKFTLYALIDDYFQSEADWPAPLEFAGNILRSDHAAFLPRLGFAKSEILLYKAGVAAYLREPGIDTLSFLQFRLIPDKKDEKLARSFFEEYSEATVFLEKFKKVAVEKCVEEFRRYS